MNKIYNLFFLISFSVVINGCGNQRPAQRFIYPIEKSYKETSLSLWEEKILKGSNVLVKIHKVVDDRLCQNNIGVFCSSEIIINDLSTWINSYFATLEKHVKPLNNNQEILLDIYIKKLYLQNISSSKAATIVLHVDYLHNNHVILSKTYREQLAEVNWNCSEDEIIAILNNVLNSVRKKVIEDLNSLKLN